MPLTSPLGARCKLGDYILYRQWLGLTNSTPHPTPQFFFKLGTRVSYETETNTTFLGS